MILVVVEVDLLALTDIEPCFDIVLQSALYNDRNLASDGNLTTLLGDDLLTLGAYDRVGLALGNLGQEGLDLACCGLVEQDHAACTDQRTVDGVRCRTGDDLATLVEAQLTGLE